MVEFKWFEVLACSTVYSNIRNFLPEEAEALFDPENIEKLKNSTAYRSALYYDALKNIH